jgi:two-component system phosphate regulon sensor histidine kinase PhoR
MVFAALAAAVVAGTGAAAGLGAVYATVLSAAVCSAAIFALSRWPRKRPTDEGPATRAGGSAADPIGGLAPDLLHALPLGLLFLDGTGRVLLCNAAAEEIIERQVTGMRASSALRAPALTEAIAAALSDRRRAEFDVTLLRSKERVIHACVVPIGKESAEQGAAQVLVQMEDRTRAAKAEALRRDFVANASHELRTPLASISGFIETLQGHARGDAEATERFLKIMASQADRMRRLIDDLLSLNRIEINEHVQPRDRVDVLAAVRETATALAPIAQAAGTRVDVDLPDASVLVRGSQDELAQVFANLMDNAVKYAASGGPIRVAFHKGDAGHPGMVGISVTDRGPGIAREHVPRLTERFYRVSNARSRERGGTGLGLAIAKHIINRHRGDLAVTSTLGEGSCFTVWLPTLPHPTAGDERTRRPG